MASLVEELQRDVLNSEVRITELLRKSLVVATKLKLDEFATWTRRELEGYGGDKVPDYRVLHGRPEVYNPYRGFIPFSFGDDVKGTQRISKIHFNQPIGELEYSLTDKSGSGSDFRMSYSTVTEQTLMKTMPIPLQPSLLINASRVKGVLEAVRDIILNWSLKLESDGIIGDGMSFTSEEKERAQAGVVHNVNNFFHGDIQNSQVQIETTSSLQSQSVEFDVEKLEKLVEALRSTIDVIGIDQGGRKELESAISALEAQAKEPKPEKSLIGDSLTSVRHILEGASGNLVANGLLNQMGSLFGA